MEGPDRPTSRALDSRLSEEPWSFGFFNAVRLLEAEHPDGPRVGRSRRLKEDFVRFGQLPSLAFAPATLATFGPEDHLPVPRLRVNFLGLLGPDGPMPIHFSEYVRQREYNERDQTLMQFLDVFHHRMISLHYRAWASSRPTVSRDRKREDLFAGYVAAMLGIQPPAFQDRDHLPDDAKLFFAARLGPGPRTAEGLASIISDYFDVPSRLVEYIGTWIDIPRRHRLRFGRQLGSAALGKTTIVGKRLFDRQQKIRVVLGPLSWADYQRFLPIHRSFKRLADWIRLYTTLSLDWDVQLILKASEVPATKLGAGDGTGRLGWTTWLATTPPENDAGDLIISSGVAA